MTLGYGPDFAVLRSRGVLMNIPRMARELQEEIPEGSINDGGHLVVGSIKFIGGLRTKVLAKLAEKIGHHENCSSAFSGFISYSLQIHDLF